MSLFKSLFPRWPVTRRISLFGSTAQSYNFLLHHSRSLASLPQIDDQSYLETENGERKKKENLRPLDVVFKEAMGLIPRAEYGGDEIEGKGNELKGQLKELEREVRDLKSKPKPLTGLIKLLAEKRERVKPLESANRELKSEKKEEVLEKNVKSSKTLVKLFADAEERGEKLKEERLVFKELSKDMKMLVSHLQKEGYFRNANFMKGRSSDFRYFEINYGRDFLKFAAEKFGEDHQDIAKWLSGSDLKKVALFGCPSLAKKNVYAAKRLRAFFEIQEDTVCRDCSLKNSCKAANKPVWRAQEKNLKLSDVMKVITSYGLDSDSLQLVVPDEIKASLSRLLREVLNLSQNSARASAE